MLHDLAAGTVGLVAARRAAAAVVASGERTRPAIRLRIHGRRGRTPSPLASKPSTGAARCGRRIWVWGEELGLGEIRDLGQGERSWTPAEVVVWLGDSASTAVWRAV
jgi:hypothetical protein